MRTNDYRNTEYCPTLENVIDKKSSLDEKIRKEHPRIKILYNKINERNSKYNAKFREIYNCKCVYCGTSIDILPATLFEVDHFVAESLYDSKEEAGKIENLVLSCYKCNRNKKDFSIENRYIDVLNIDSGNITKVFYRDKQYYIKVREVYENDEIIKEFYKKLQFNHQVRRLDYLLMNMVGLHKKIEGTKQGEKLAECILMLQKKRNFFT